jgi:hypothetical protein
LPCNVFIQANKKQIEFLRNKVQKMNEKTVATKATMTMVTTNGDGAISVEAIALIDAIFEAVTRSESWNGAHVVYRGGEFSAAPDTARIGSGGVVMSVSNPQDFWGSESVEGLMEYLTENAADLLAQANDIIEAHSME